MRRAAGLDHALHAHEVGVHLALGIGAEQARHGVAEGARGRHIAKAHADSRAAIVGRLEALPPVVVSMEGFEGVPRFYGLVEFDTRMEWKAP